jgi:hypothetical protein
VSGSRALDIASPHSSSTETACTRNNAPDDSQPCFEHSHVSAPAAADPWRNSDAGRVGERRRHDHRLEDWNRPLWFHAAEPHGLGWADPGLPVDDDYCGIAVDWLAPGECEEMECGRCIGALSPSHCRSLFIRCIPINGSAENGQSRYCFPLCLALS